MAMAPEELPVLLQLRRSSNDGSDKPRAPVGQGKRHDAGISVTSSVLSTRRPLEELLTAMRKGADLMKHGRQGRPKIHYFRLADNDNLLTWRSAKGQLRSVHLKTVTQVVAGQTTESFKRYLYPGAVHRSFSLLYKDSKSDNTTRTLDLTASSEQDFELWFCGLQALVDYMRPPPETTVSKGRISLSRPQLSSPLAGAVGMPFGGPESGTSLKSPPISVPKMLQITDGTSKLSPPGLGGGTAQGRATGAMGVPVPEHQPGDCYMWGASRPVQPAYGSKLRVQSSVPQPIKDTTHLDVMEVAVGLSHAGLLTRRGEMYSWGDGTGGKLGLGHQVDADSPQRLHTLWGQPVRHIAVSDSCTAAITGDGQLLTWGEASTDSLGYSGVQRQYIPRPVAGPLSDNVIVQVSCGSFHSAAVTSDGCLFTWGNGLCGKLGHGDHRSCSQPRKVEALKDKLVTQVACGAWHTAAVASPRPQGPDVLEGLPFIERLAVQHKLAAMYELTEEDDGSLYTWGCAFTWTTEHTDAASQATKRQLDHHRGCLGLDDTAGRLTPTRVGGGLEGLAVTCIAVGLAFTVAVTADGTAWQMGETGVSGKAAPWEGALVPAKVGGELSKHFVESVAAGRHHVAAMAGPLDGATGKAHEGLESTVIFMWGRGREGQLGTGAAADSAAPQLVEELRGRRVLQVACGGYQTMAVCLHDPKADDTEERRKGYKAKMKQWFGGRMTLDIPLKEGPPFGPPSASSLGGGPKQLSMRETIPPGRPASVTGSATEPRSAPLQSLRKTMSGSGLAFVSPETDKRLRKGRHKYGALRQAAHDSLPPSGLSTPKEVGRVRTSVDIGFASEPNLSPRDEELLRASSGGESKPGSLAATENFAELFAAGKTGALEPHAEGTARDAYVRALEAKVEQLQSRLLQPGRGTTPRVGATARVFGSAETRPSIVDLSLPLTTLTESRLASNSFASTSRLDQPPGGATLLRGTHLGFGQGQKRQSRAAQLPNARSSTLLQALEDVSQVVAGAHDLSKEAADLARMHAALATQLKQVEQRQLALHRAGIDPPPEEAHHLQGTEQADHTAGDGESRAQGAPLPSTRSAPSTESAARRRDVTQGVRVRGHHRRSRSSSGSGSLKLVPLSPFATASPPPATTAAPQTSPPAPPELPKNEEVAPGVFLSVGPDSEGYNKVTHIRFARQRFSKAAADDWWHAHKHDLARKYNLRSRSSPEQPETSTVRPLLPGSHPWTPSSEAPSSESKAEWHSSSSPASGHQSARRNSAGGGVEDRPDSNGLEEALQRGQSGNNLWPDGGTLHSTTSEETKTSRSRLDFSPPALARGHFLREHAVSPLTSDAATPNGSPGVSPGFHFERPAGMPEQPPPVRHEPRKGGIIRASNGGPGKSKVAVSSPLAIEAAKPSRSSELGITVAPDVHAETGMSKLQLPLGRPRSDIEAAQPSDPVASRSTHEESEESFGSARSSTAGEDSATSQSKAGHTPVRNRLTRNANTARRVAAWETQPIE